MWGHVREQVAVRLRRKSKRSGPGAYRPGHPRGPAPRPRQSRIPRGLVGNVVTSVLDLAHRKRRNSPSSPNVLISEAESTEAITQGRTSHAKPAHRRAAGDLCFVGMLAYRATLSSERFFIHTITAAGLCRQDNRPTQFRRFFCCSGWWGGMQRSLAGDSSSESLLRNWYARQYTGNQFVCGMGHRLRNGLLSSSRFGRQLLARSRSYGESRDDSERGDVQAVRSGGE